MDLLAAGLNPEWLLSTGLEHYLVHAGEASMTKNTQKLIGAHISGMTRTKLVET